MAAGAGTVGLLKAVLTADTTNFDAGMKKAAAGPKAVEKSVSQLGESVQKLTPQADRMVKALGGDRLLYTANNLAAAVQRIGGATKLTEAEQARANRTVTEAIAKYRILGQQAPKALLDLEAATRRTDVAVGGLGGRFTAMVGAFTVGGLLTRGIASISRLGHEAIASSGRLVDLRDKTGLTLTTLQRMEHVSSQTGDSLDSMTQSAFLLGTRLAGGGDSVRRAVQTLGLDFEKLRASSPDQMWEAVNAALGRVESTTERNRLGTELYGKSFAAIAATVASGYKQIADQAVISSDKQLEALDRAGDAWERLKGRVSKGIQQAEGSFALGVEEGISNWERAQRRSARIRAGLLPDDTNGRSDVDLPALPVPAAEVKAFESYRLQLRAAQLELTHLTAADRAEISAAQQLGAETEDLTTRFNISATALRLLTAQMKETTKVAKDTITQLDQIATFDAINKYRLEGFAFNMNASMAAQGIRVPKPAQLVGIADTIDRTALRNAVSTSAALRGDRSMRVVVDEWRARWEALQLDMTGAFSDSIAQMLTGLRGFKQSFLDIWASIRQSFASIVSGLIQTFVTGFVGKLTGAGSAALAGGVAGTAIGGGAAAATAAGGTAVAGGAAAGGGIGATIAGLATNPFTIAAAGGLLLGLGIWKGGLFRGGFEGTEGNKRRDRYLSQFGDPSNKGVGGAGHNLASMLSGFGAGPGGGRLFSALQSADSDSELVNAQRSINSFLGVHGKRGLKAFNLGGFVPPGVNQPAMLHGGSMGEIIAPVEKLLQAGGARHIHNHYYTVQGWDGEDIDRVFRQQIIPRQKRALQLNQDDMLGHTKRVLG